MRTLLVFASFFLSPAPADEAEDRLVQAELLEVSAGDVEKAAEAYRAIAGDEKAPASVRARARLCLGRSQRKLGRLDAAKKTLEDLIRDHAGETEVVRQAQSFLKELQSGRASNPDFDWIREVEKNPEIQARVFEWTMSLVSEKREDRTSAERQLLALGTIALPVVERVLEASRDSNHRMQLAIIAVRAGRIERVTNILDPVLAAALENYALSGMFMDLVRLLPSWSADDLKRVREAVAAAPANPSTAAARAALLLGVGDDSDLPAKLKALEPSAVWSTDLLHPILVRRADAAEIFAARILDRGAPLDIRRGYAELLLWDAPEKLGVEHLGVFEEIAGKEGSLQQDSSLWRAMERLERLGRFDVLEAHASNAWGAHMVSFIKQRYFFSVDQDKLRLAPGKWGAVLRKARRYGDDSFPLLHRLAEVNDEAAEQFAGFLRAKDAEWPRYLPYGARKNLGWTPSARYAELMAGLLDSRDPVVLAIALEALAIAPKGVGPDVLPAIEKLILDPPDGIVREFALYALLQRFAARPESGAETARLLFKDYQKWRSRDLPPSEESPLSKAQSLGRIVRTSPGALVVGTPSGGGGAQRRGADTLSKTWVAATLGKRVLVALLPHVLGLGYSAETEDFIMSYQRPITAEEAAEAVFAEWKSFDTPEKRAAVARIFDSGHEAVLLTARPEGLELLRSVALDSKTPDNLRAIALVGGGESAKDWIDWAKLASTNDPFLEQALGWGSTAFAAWLLSAPATEREKVLAAMASSSSPEVRRLRLRANRDGRPEPLLKALDDPDPGVQLEAIVLMTEGGVVADPRFCTRLLANPSGRDLRALALVARQGDAACIEPLVKLLDDTNESVRQAALGALKSIKARMEEKKEWEAIVNAMKTLKKE